jgi:putative FmdB family regulatory protein
MPTYEYKCESCGLTFERRQSMTEIPLSECPDCRGKVRRLVGGGTGFILKGSSHGKTGHNNRQSCSLEQAGRTCCGREERCGKPPCGGKQ